MVAGKLGFTSDKTLGEVATDIDAIEARIREVVPIARVIYLEPDIYHAPTEPVADTGTAGASAADGTDTRP
jgi:hypothetical protein